MTVQHGPAPLLADTAACVGAFDGLHIGHQALLARARSLASHLAIVTFDPHPARVLAPDRTQRLLQTAVQRQRVCRSLGVDALVLLAFDREMASLDPAQFVRRYLVDSLAPVAVVVGQGFRFGHNRSGQVEDLREALAPAGIQMEAVAELPGPEPSTKISSTLIRAAIDRGDVDTASSMLGRWHAVAGPVVRGQRRGRALGFPTANIDCAGAYLPCTGIYATTFAVWDESSQHFGKVWPSVASIGHNPTFGEGHGVTLEVYVLDLDLGESLYDAEVEVSFVARLRDEIKFEGVEPLVRQMHADVDQARPLFTADAMSRVVAPGDP